MTRQEIKNKTVESPIVFHDDEHFEIYLLGLQDGVDVAERELIDKACKIFEEYLNNTYQLPQHYTNLSPSARTTMKKNTIDTFVHRFRMTLIHM